MSPELLVIALAFATVATCILVVRHPVWLLYILIFVLLEPSRYLSLYNVSLGFCSVKSYEFLLPLVYVAALIHARRPLWRCLPPFFLPFFLLTLVSLLHGLMTGYGAGAFNYFRPFFSMWMVAVIPMLFKSSQDTMRLARFFTLCATAFIVLEMVALQTGLGYSFFYSPVRASYSSLMSDTSCSNMAFIFIYLFATFDLGMRHALLRLLLIGFSFACTIMSSARAVWVGMLTACLGFLALARTRTKLYLTLFSVLGVVGVFCLGSLYIARYDMTLAERIPLLFQKDEGNARWRMMAWTQTVEDIKARPILGWPMGNEPFFYVETSGTFNSNATHNEYLKIARYTGLPGIFCFLMLVGGLTWRCTRNVISSDGEEQRHMLGLLLCIVFILVTSTFSQRITSIDMCTFVWGIMGCANLRLLEVRERQLAARGGRPE